MSLRVMCPDCKEVSVAATVVTIRNCADNDRWSYRFICPTCELRAAGTTSKSAALEAVAVGADYETWRLPVELLERAYLPPLTLDDLAELRASLEEPEWLGLLTRSPNDTERWPHVAPSIDHVAPPAREPGRGRPPRTDRHRRRPFA